MICQNSDYYCSECPEREQCNNYDEDNLINKIKEFDKK